VLEKSATEFFRQVGKAGKPTLEDAKIPEWSARDQKLLVLGIVTFGLSSVIKLVLVFNQATAAAPPVGQVPPPPSATSSAR
jgi:hypothetical protein